MQFVETKERWPLPSVPLDAWRSATAELLPSGEDFPTLRPSGKESQHMTKNVKNVVVYIAFAESNDIGLIESITLDSKLENISSVIQNLQENRLEIAKAISTQARSTKSRHTAKVSGLAGLFGVALFAPALFSEVTWTIVGIFAIGGLTIAAVYRTNLLKSYFFHYEDNYGQFPETDALLQEYLTVCEEIKSDNDILKAYDVSPNN